MGVSCHDESDNKKINIKKYNKITSKVIWIDPHIENIENIAYINELISYYFAKVKTFKNVQSAIQYIKEIKFYETKIIVTSSIYSDLVEAIKENITDIYFAPKIIVFTSSFPHFYEKNKDYQKIDIFYKYGGITTSFNNVKTFLLDDSNVIINENNILQKYNKLPNEVQLTFEYIDCKEKLMLPLFFKVLISDIDNYNLKVYTNLLYNTYSKEKKIEALLNSIKSVTNIPIEILSKYYSRLYTIESDFYKDLNRDLGLNKTSNYISFIKVLYEGVKLKSLPLSSDKVLYRGSKISNNEINKIQLYLKKKKPYLPGAIVFSRSFLSFSKERSRAEFFLHSSKNIKGLSKVLYILEKDDSIGYSLATHGDLEKISFYPKEKEVLFFPFSSFEIQSIQYLYDNFYEIRLLYLGKYLPDIKNDYDEELRQERELEESLESMLASIDGNHDRNSERNSDKNSFKKIKEKLIPNSEFKKQLSGVRLIPNEKLLNLTTKSLYDLYKQYENEINDNSSDDSGGPQPQMNQMLECPDVELAREYELLAAPVGERVSGEGLAEHPEYTPRNQGGGASSEGDDDDLDAILRSLNQK